jgi:hypothetical protein
MSLWKYDQKELSKLSQALNEAMGNVCAWACSDDPCEGSLERHHPNGRDYKPRQLSWRQRLKRYWQDYREGNLMLLCEKHHGVADR